MGIETEKGAVVPAPEDDDGGCPDGA